MAKNLMIQGTMSNAGKSIITAGILRVLKQDGYNAAPFKSQNMALNSYITADGLEMGRAQVMQAEAAGIAPCVEMNPILLKPTSDVGSQVIVNGTPLKNMPAKEYFQYKKKLVPDILKAYDALDRKYDVIVLEGAGSPAEINLKKDDIVNMGMAELVDAPVLLVGDIDRGGVFAQLVGTIMLLEEKERRRVKGLVMNKFRGDRKILNPNLIILPGSKNTINDLKWLRKNGIEAQIIKCARQEIPVFGICGGYQMLGNVIDDSCNAETGEVIPGIGLLPVTTTFTLSKHRTRARGIICSQSGMWEMLGEKKCAGYEIHMGESTVSEGQAHAFAKIYNTVDGTEYMDGCVCGNVAGTYLHGIFDEKEFCDGFINMLGKRCGIATHGGSDMSFEEYKQREYDKLADAIRENMDMKYIYEIMGL